MGTRSWNLLRALAFTLVVVGLPTGYLGCGSGAGGDLPDGSDAASDPGVMGITLEVPSAGQTTWEAMVAEDAARPPIVEFAEPPLVTPPPPAALDAEALASAAPGAPPPTPHASSGQSLVVRESFEALPQLIGIYPPDTNGAVGPNHVVTMLNSHVRIQGKTGSSVQPDVRLTTFFSAAGHSDVFDPKVLYDAESGRWIACACATRRSANSAMVFAISDTNDPTGTWTYYALDGDATDTLWVDFPGFGVNSRWIVMTANMFPISSGSFGVRMWVIDKSTALAGGVLTVTDFVPPFSNTAYGTGHTIKPCVCMEPIDDLWLVDMDWYSGGQQAFRLSHLTGTASAPVWSIHPGALGGVFAYPTNFTSSAGAPQLGSTATVTTNGGGRVWSEPVWRNGHMWWTYHGGFPASGQDRTVAFWHQLDPTPATPTFAQSGVFDGGAGVHHFFSAIAVNQNDDALVGFTRCDATRYAEAVLAWRNGIDAPGTMGQVALMKAGEAPYTSGRWGDYSAAVVDPSDDLTMWTIQEYAKSPQSTWSTWWTEVTPDTIEITDCPNDLTLPCTNGAGADHDITVTITNQSGDAFIVSFWVDGVEEQIRFIPAASAGLSWSTETFSWSYPFGTTSVEIRAASTGTSRAWCTFDVTVEDGEDPVITCPGTPVRAECDGTSGVVVTFAATATDGCDPDPAITYSQDPGTAFPLGTTTVTCTATDTVGNTATCDFDVVVEDTTPPVVTASARRMMLFVPRNGLIDVLLERTATDLCDDAVATQVEVWSNQTDTGAPFSPDAQVVGDTLQVRAEVDLTSADPGRVYLILVTATDASGNEGRAGAWVVVPKTATALDLVGARNIATAAEADYEAVGTIPAGWFQVLIPTPLP